MSDKTKTAGGSFDETQMAGQGLTRRKWMAVSVGGLLAASGYVIIRRLTGSERVGMSIEGPFKEYGSVSLEDLDVPKEYGAFRPVRMKLSGNHQNADRVYIVFTFQGDEDPSRVLKVKCVARDDRGREIAQTVETFHDPRIAAKKPQRSGLKLDPTANITLRLPKGTLLSKVQSIDLYVDEDN